MTPQADAVVLAFVLVTVMMRALGLSWFWAAFSTALAMTIAAGIAAVCVLGI